MNNSAITVEHVTKAVGNRQLLVDVSCVIPKGTLTTIIGPNGAGKSTLVKIILGLDSSYTGTVTIAPDETIQYIPQLNNSDIYELPLSVQEYLSIGSTSLYSRLRETPDFVQALQHVQVSPDRLTQNYASLSGGERQRIAIARALLTQPTLLVLDEPLAAVDYASRQGLYELIRHLQQDHHITVLLVSHDIESVLPLSDRVLCLNKTLHTNCHPSELPTDRRAIDQLIHHHCAPGHPLSSTLEDSPY